MKTTVVYLIGGRLTGDLKREAHISPPDRPYALLFFLLIWMAKINPKKDVHTQ